MNQDQVHHLRAVEALRAGVPNRDVVRLLEPAQTDVEERFEALLDAVKGGPTAGKPLPGLLLEGDFGTGKSHWLERLRHVALEHNFVCSHIVLNKETPLHDLGKILRAAVESAVAPGRTGPALAEIAHSYDAAATAGYRELFEWVHGARELDPRLAITLLLFEKSRDEAVISRIIDEWIGFPMYVGELKLALNELGEKMPAIPKARRGDALLRFEFLSRFFRSAGYSGWVVLLDEAEMVSKYSLRQRGKSYAHMAQLMGIGKNTGVPGLATVFTITKDYAGQVLRGRKNDAVNIAAKMENTKDEVYVAPALAGMRAIEKQGIDLRPLSREQVNDVYRKARALYARAYEWDAPELEHRREYSSSTGMRQYLRSWINAWDLRRLYNYEADTVAEDVAVDYSEDPDMQNSLPEDEPFVTL